MSAEEEKKSFLLLINELFSKVTNKENAIIFHALSFLLRSIFTFSSRACYINILFLSPSSLLPLSLYPPHTFPYPTLLILSLSFLIFASLFFFFFLFASFFSLFPPFCSHFIFSSSLLGE